MAKHIYDDKDRYKGKILSDEEHAEKVKKDLGRVLAQREASKALIKKEKNLIVNCKVCSKKINKYLNYPTRNPDVFFKGIISPDAYCLFCYKNYLNNQFLGLTLLLRKNPSFKFVELTIKNKIVVVFQLLFILIFSIIILS